MDKNTVSLTCKVCGGVFIRRKKSKPASYCSHACRGQSMKGVRPANYIRKPYPCAYCGVVVERAPGQLKKEVFCSQKCGNASRVGQPAHNKMEQVTKACLVCNAEFKSRACDARLYCSKNCGFQARGASVSAARLKIFARVQLPCAWCGVMVEKRPCEVKTNNYCSRSCLGSATSHAQMGRRSKIEIMVEEVLLAIGVAFEIQKRVGRWTVDFYLTDRGEALEVDGDYWHSRPEVQARDERKNVDLQAKGIAILRLKESAIRADATAAVQAVLAGVAVTPEPTISP